MISHGLPLPLERLMIPCSVRRAVMDLTVRSDLPISLATNFWGDDGFCSITRNTAISSKVQFLHFAGSPRAKFALVNVGLAEAHFVVLFGFQSLAVAICRERFNHTIWFAMQDVPDGIVSGNVFDLSTAKVVF